MKKIKLTEIVIDFTKQSEKWHFLFIFIRNITELPTDLSDLHFLFILKVFKLIHKNLTTSFSSIMFY